MTIADATPPKLTRPTSTLADVDRPSAVATGSDGTIYVGGRGYAETLWQVTPPGMVTVVDESPNPGVLGLAVAADGTVYYALANHTIRRWSPTGGVSTLAGTPGVAGAADGVGTAARFHNPSGLAVDAGGTLYVADRDNHRIRKITSAGAVTTVAGSTAGFADAVGTAAQFHTPMGVAVRPDGSLLVADWGNARVRLVAGDGRVTTYAGRGVVWA